MGRNGFVRVALAVSLLAVPAAADEVVFNNFPISGAINGQSIGLVYGNAVTNSFALTADTTIYGANLGVWLYAGDAITSLGWGVGTTPFGFEVAADTAPVSTGLAGSPDYTGSNPNSFGYYVNVARFGFNSPLTVLAGTYYLSIFEAVTTSGADAYWDENDTPGIDAIAFADGSFVSVGAESFQILTPEPSAYFLLGTGLLALGWAPRKIFRRRAGRRL